MIMMLLLRLLLAQAVSSTRFMKSLWMQMLKEEMGKLVKERLLAIAKETVLEMVKERVLEMLILGNLLIRWEC
jgi:hypothetical protein